jgi:hypothetical protein
VNDDEFNEMNKIWENFKFKKTVKHALENKIYGYDRHLHIYQDVARLNKMTPSQQKAELETYNTNQLRDIQSKISSSGKTGRKFEMIPGICKKLREFVRN